MSKILYLPTRYYPAISGAEFYFQRIAEILTLEYNYDIEIFTSDAIDFRSLRDSKGKILGKNSKYYHNVNNLKINRFSINYNDLIDIKMKNIKNISAYQNLNLSDKTLAQLLKNGPYLIDLIRFFLNNYSNNYKIIHTTFYPYFNLIISLIIRNFMKIPSICTPFFHFANPRYLNPDLLQILKKFDKLIACTNLEKKKLIDLLNVPTSRIEVIPMGVDYQKFMNKPRHKQKSYNFKQNFFYKNEKKSKMVLFCGYKNYEKGAISILKAIPYIIQEDNKIYFVFIGPSTLAFNRELSNLQKKQKVRIINLTPDNLTGYYDKKKIAAFKETDIFLMPSRSDAFGIAFLEAWASGKPVIGASIGATPEVIQNNINGLLVEFDDPIDIAKKVIFLLKHKSLKRKMGLQGRKKVKEDFNWKKVAQKTHLLYQKMISSSEVK